MHAGSRRRLRLRSGRGYDLRSMAAVVAAAERVVMLDCVRLGMLVGVVAFAACRAPDAPVSDDAMLAAITPALEIGRTTREDALLRFGAPVERFEGDRILCWRLAVDADGQRPVSQYVSPWYGSAQTQQWTNAVLDPRVRIELATMRSLVLVFDGGGVLRKARALRQP